MYRAVVVVMDWVGLTYILGWWGVTLAAQAELCNIPSIKSTQPRSTSTTATLYDGMLIRYLARPMSPHTDVKKKRPPKTRVLFV